LEATVDKNLVDEFQQKVFSKYKEVDPSEEQDWYSLALGWALARNLSAEEAHSFAQHVSYNIKGENK
jgi:hypothetical protein